MTAQDYVPRPEVEAMSVAHARMSRILFTTLVAASLVWGCDPAVKPSSSEPSSSAAAQASPSVAAAASESAAASASLEPSSSPTDDASPSPSASAPTSPSPTAITVKFTQSIADHHWGDPQFMAKATATNGRRIQFTANGGCRVEAQSGKVTIEDVGTCTVKATVPSADPPVSASQTFRILRATPVITAKNQTARFARPMRYAVKLSVSPKIPLKFTVKHHISEDAWCAVTSTGILTFSHEPTGSDFPGIPFDCYVEIAAAGTSPNWVAPATEIAKIHLDYAAFHVDPDPKPIDFSTSDSVTFDIRETSGDALGMNVFGGSSSGIGSCEVTKVTPVHPKAGTTRYAVTVKALDDPNGIGAYDCVFQAQAAPPDYYPGNPQIEFKVHVKP